MRRIKMQKSYHLPCSLVLEQCFHKVFLQVNFSAVLKCDVTPAERANPVGTTIVLLLQSRGGQEASWQALQLSVLGWREPRGESCAHGLFGCRALQRYVLAL